MRAAVENTAFRAASSRSVWPGTEDRQAEPAPAAPQPYPGGPGVSSFGPLGAGLPPDTGQADRSARRDEQIWEPRRRYHQPLLKRRRWGDPASRNRYTQPQPSHQAPQQQDPQQGTAPTKVRSGKTAVPTARNQRARNQRARNQRAQRSRTRRNSTVTFRSGGLRSPRAATRRAVPAHTQLARTARRVPAATMQARLGPGPVGTERMADRLHLGDLMADSRIRIWKRRLLLAIVAGRSSRLSSPGGRA